MAKKATKHYVRTSKTKAKLVGTSTALAPRPPQQLPEVLPPDNLANILGDQPALGSLGTIEITLSPKEEAELSTPVNPLEVLIKPSGQPYLPHAQYRRWFIRAFGRLGWMLVPKAKPVKVTLPPSKWDIKDGRESTRHVVLVPYMLYIHGKPAAFSWGEQEFNETNAEQSYGDAVAATESSAIRRCAKAIGVGLELWDQDWLRRWVAEHAVAVQVRNNNYTNTKWRRKADPPFDGEFAQATPETPRGGSAPDTWQADDGHFEEQAPPRRTPPSAGHDGQGDALITKPQRQRLVTIAKKAGRIEADIRLYLKKAWKINSSADIKRKDYDAICNALEAPGALPLPGDGE